ncbi:MAG: NAD(P)H-hydrate dehydratase [Bifidobacteriaceae bacterium]|jgi:hydroxyethylthiazole kinase-like uncharacterized protein yjeF|nr:NAD(P)H-hydrate dehydratase [Bifidobacteriaceae bacterium]
MKPKQFDDSQLLELFGQYYRPPISTDHKYSRGVVGLITGSKKYAGAAILSSSSSVLSGAGMVKYFDCENLRESVITVRPEVVIVPLNKFDEKILQSAKVQAWVLGSGVDLQNCVTSATIEYLVQQFFGPIVLDASGLEVLRNLLIAGDKVSEKVVITPHLGEARKLLVAAGVELAGTDFDIAAQLHKLTGATVLLKGSTTYILNSAESYSVTSESTWLASAGTGDVLAGLLGTILAQNAQRQSLSTTEIAQIVALGQCIFNRAATLYGDKPLPALELAKQFPQAISNILAQL